LAALLLLGLSAAAEASREGELVTELTEGSLEAPEQGWRKRLWGKSLRSNAPKKAAEKVPNAADVAALSKRIHTAARNAATRAHAKAQFADAQMKATSQKAYQNATQAGKGAMAIAKGLIAKAAADQKLAQAIQKKNELTAAAQKAAENQKLEAEAKAALEADKAREAAAQKKAEALRARLAAQKPAPKSMAKPVESLAQRTARLNAETNARTAAAVAAAKAGEKKKSPNAAQKKAAESVAAANALVREQLQRKTASGLALWESVNELRKARAFRLKADQARKRGVEEYGLTIKEFDQGMQENEAGKMVHDLVKQFRKWSWKVYSNGYKLRERPNDGYRPVEDMQASVDKELMEIKNAVLSATDRVSAASEGSKTKAKERETLLAAYKAELRHEDLDTKLRKLQAQVDTIYNQAYSILHDKFPKMNLQELADGYNKVVASKAAQAKANKEKAPPVVPRMTAAGVKSLLGLESDMLKGAYLAYTIKVHSQKLRAQRKAATAAYQMALGVQTTALANQKGIAGTE
jgi:hypothetical protein